MMNRRGNLKALALASAMAAGTLSFSLQAQAADTIKVGILHSLSGTMAISETVLKDTVLMAIDEINAKGGVLGKKLEPVVVDPASNWPLFAEKTKQLLGQDKVSVIFGCWTSVSRKSVLPVVEEMNGLLFYPVQYEGEELSKNVFYTGAAPNQQAIPAVDYLMSKDGGAAKRWVLLGTDYVYPRTTNKILRAYLISKGVKESDIDEKYTPFGHSDYQTIVADIKKFSAGGKTAVVSTINGDSNVPFYKELCNAGLKAKDVPVVAFSVGKEEFRGVDTERDSAIRHMPPSSTRRLLNRDTAGSSPGCFVKASMPCTRANPAASGCTSVTSIFRVAWGWAVRHRMSEAVMASRPLSTSSPSTSSAPSVHWSAMAASSPPLKAAAYVSAARRTAAMTSVATAGSAATAVADVPAIMNSMNSMHSIDRINTGDTAAMSGRYGDVSGMGACMQEIPRV